MRWQAQNYINKRARAREAVLSRLLCVMLPAGLGEEPCNGPITYANWQMETIGLPPPSLFFAFLFMEPIDPCHQLEQIRPLQIAYKHLTEFSLMLLKIMWVFFGLQIGLGSNRTESLPRRAVISETELVIIITYSKVMQRSALSVWMQMLRFSTAVVMNLMENKLSQLPSVPIRHFSLGKVNYPPRDKKISMEALKWRLN